MLTTTRSIHNFDEIYAQTKTLFLCKFFLLILIKFYTSFKYHVRYIRNCIFFHIIAKKLPKNVNKSAVFACNELDLDEIKVYGFDYDYTLACYKQSMHDLLYGLARDMLVEKYKVNI